MLRLPTNFKHLSIPRTTPKPSLLINRFQPSHRPFHNTPPFLKMSSSSTDTTAIRALFRAYESALRASSTAAVLPLYAPSGIFMAQHFPTAIGTSAIQAAYDKVFDMIVLAPSFSVHEIEILSDDWVFARTSSAGSTKIKASGKMVEEANQELFLLQRVEGEWKFARYCFCTVLPPRGA